MKRWTALAVLFAGLVGIDQWTKQIAVAELMTRPTIRMLGDMFRLQYAENRGGFLSFGADFSNPTRFLVFVVMSTIGLAVLAWIGFRQRPIDRKQAVGFTVILAGGASNLFDRIANGGYVIDFLNVGIGPLRTGVFNIADMAILFGTGLLLWDHFSRKQPTGASEETIDAGTTENG